MVLYRRETLAVLRVLPAVLVVSLQLPQFRHQGLRGDESLHQPHILLQPVFTELAFRPVAIEVARALTSRLLVATILNLDELRDDLVVLVVQVVQLPVFSLALVSLELFQIVIHGLSLVAEVFVEVGLPSDVLEALDVQVICLLLHVDVVDLGQPLRVVFHRNNIGWSYKIHEGTPRATIWNS